jgi:hypothetical protein
MDSLLKFSNDENRPHDDESKRAEPQSAATSDGALPDPFNPARLRLSQDFASTIGVKKVLSTMPVRKPSKESFFRVHPDEAYRVQTAVIELKEERETYLVDPQLWADLAGESTFGPRQLITAINRQGVPFILPIRLPGPDGKIDSWNQSLMEAAMMALDQWVRIQANMSLGAYDIFVATGDIPSPTWPDIPFRDLLAIAFKGRLIDNHDHPVLRRLRGEA